MDVQSISDQGLQEHQRIALDLLTQGRFADAEKVLSDALRDEQSSERWNDWATAQAAWGNFEKAEAGLLEAVKLNPNYSQAAVNLGFVFAKQGRSAEAIGWLERGASGIDEKQQAQITQLQAECRRRLAPDTPVHPSGPLSLFDAYGNRKLAEIFGDQSSVPLTDSSLRWLRPPSKSLLAYCRNREPLPFDGVPPDPNSYLKDPTYRLAQAHRVSVTLDAVARHWPLGRRGPILDLGAFPFTFDVAVREYLGFANPIIGTINQQIPQEWRECLEALDITLMPTNLDPYVKNTEELAGISDSIQAEPGSMEFVLFAHVIEHLYHPAKILREAHGVLRKGGKILLSTDNAFLLSGLCNYLTASDHLHEPVQGTAAMSFSTWRGHVRFFTASDLHALLTSAGFTVIETQFHEVLYNSFLPEYFRHPVTSLPRWRAELLTQFPQYRNEIIVMAEKP